MRQNDTHIDGKERGVPDIRRRYRSLSDAGQYTLKILLERFRLRGRALKGACVILLGFSPQSSEKRSQAARTIQDTLSQQGAKVRLFDVEGEPKVPETALQGADAVIIATDSRIFRYLRPADFRKLGIDTVIPATLE